MSTTTTDLTAALRDAVLDAQDSGSLDLADHVTGLATFEESGVLTRDDGLVLRLADGSEFQLTVVQSR